MVSHYYWNTDGQDCTKSACQIVASGWPVPFIWDKIWNSPVNSADWIGVLLTVDHLNTAAFIRNTMFWTFMTFLGLFLLKAFKQTKQPTTAQK